MSVSSVANKRVFVFDLDGLLWSPEMYELWGGGGSPFEWKDSKLYDSQSERIFLLGECLDVMIAVFEDSNARLAVASSCDEPGWAVDALRTVQTKHGSLFDLLDACEIKKSRRGKVAHLEDIKSTLKNEFEFREFVFFDNEMGNVRSVSSLGVTSVYSPCPNGVTFEHLNWVSMHPPGTKIGIRGQAL